MTQENPLLVRQGSDTGEFLAHGETPSQAQGNPLMLIHSLLRGRYKLAITLALLGLCIGAPLGYLIQTPKYKSVGVICVQPNVQKILYQTEQNGMMPMYELFLAEQAGQLRGQRVTEEAMLHPEWKAFGRGIRPQQTEEFKQSLEVTSTKGSPYIQVAFNDTDPKAAATAVKAIIETYMRFYSDAEGGEAGISMLLDKRRNDLQTALNNINQQIQSIADDYGSASLQEVYDFKLNELNRVEAQVRATEVQLVLAGGPLAIGAATAPTSGPTTAPPAGSANPAPTEAPALALFPTTNPSIPPIGAAPVLAASTVLPLLNEGDPLTMSDPILTRLYQERRAAQREVALLERRYGANHPKVEDARTAIAATDRDITERSQQLRQAQAALAPGGPGHVGGVLSPRQQLTANLKALRKMYDDLKAETIALGRKNLAIDKLRGDAVEFRERLAETKTRIEQINVEKNVGGRVNVMSYGVVPIQPEKDKRLALAGVGGIGLAALGVGFVMLLGFLDHRIHHIDAARKQLKRVDRLLGVLPQLPTDLSEVEQTSAAAHCVHQVRAMLQIRQRVTGHKSYAITSPSPGEGKTSLAIALGMSLASSGCRTLVIDCDLDGAGLSARMGRVTRRQLGQILLDLGVIGESKLQEALELAKNEKMRLGDALRKLKCMDDQTIDDALRIQRKAAPGLGEVLAGTPPERAIHSSGYPLLSILPLGSPGGAHAGRLSPDALKRLMDQISDRFDIILLDCGPILGSVEAAIVTAGIDGVILLVSRGGDRTAADAAVNLLLSAGAQIEGIVFNRAEPQDVASSVYGSSGSAYTSRSASRNASDAVDSHLTDFAKPA